MSSGQWKDVERSLKKEIESSVTTEMKARARRAQPAIYRVFNEYQRQSVETVLPHLKSALRSARFDLTPAELQTMSQNIADGDHPVLEVKPLKVRW